MRTDGFMKLSLRFANVLFGEAKQRLTLVLELRNHCSHILLCVYPEIRSELDATADKLFHRTPSPLSSGDSLEPKRKHQALLLDAVDLSHHWFPHHTMYWAVSSSGKMLMTKEAISDLQHFKTQLLSYMASSSNLMSWYSNWNKPCAHPQDMLYINRRRSRGQIQIKTSIQVKVNDQRIDLICSFSFGGNPRGNPVNHSRSLLHASSTSHALCRWPFLGLLEKYISDFSNSCSFLLRPPTGEWGDVWGSVCEFVCMLTMGRCALTLESPDYILSKNRWQLLSWRPKKTHPILYIASAFCEDAVFISSDLLHISWNKWTETTGNRGEQQNVKKKPIWGENDRSF